MFEEKQVFSYSPGLSPKIFINYLGNNSNFTVEKPSTVQDTPQDTLASAIPTWASRAMAVALPLLLGTGRFLPALLDMLPCAAVRVFPYNCLISPQTWHYSHKILPTPFALRAWIPQSAKHSTLLTPSPSLPPPTFWAKVPTHAPSPWCLLDPLTLEIVGRWFPPFPSRS